MKNQILTLRCIDFTVDFYGVCKYEGLVIFVKGLMLDEVANVKILKIKNKIAFGIIDELIEKSKYRIKEPCPVAYKCGGCDIQYIDYNYQLVLKKRLIENTLKHTHLDLKVLDTIGSDDVYSYRNKIQVPVSNDKVGYYRNHSNDIVEFDNCFITNDISNSILKDIKKLIIKYSISTYIKHVVIRNSIDEYMVCLVCNTFDIPYIDEIVTTITNKYSQIKSFMLNLNVSDTNVIFGDFDKCIFGNEYLIDKVDDLSFMIPLRSFYQINSKQMKKLYDYVIKVGELNRNDRVLDLFCGIGTISLYISKYVKEVLGVEINEKSIEYANKNKLINNVANADFIQMDANKISDYINKYDTIILDPPRKGINGELVDSLIHSSVKKIIYVSCNQATLLRDIDLLKEYFVIGNIQPLDMFPQTKHIECIVCLKRR